MGTAVTLTATPNTGYKFKQWQVVQGGVTVTGNSFTIGSADVEIKAIFEPETYTISYDLNGGKLNGQTGVVTVTAAYGSTIILPKLEREGYDFDYWKGSRYEAGASYTVTGNHTLTAQWKKQSASSSKGPKTGDDNDPGAWLMRALAAMAGLATVVYIDGKKPSRKRKK